MDFQALLQEIDTGTILTARAKDGVDQKSVSFQKVSLPLMLIITIYVMRFSLTRQDVKDDLW